MRWLPSALRLLEPTRVILPFSFLATISVCDTPPRFMMTTSPGLALAMLTDFQPLPRSVASSCETESVCSPFLSRPFFSSTAETKLAQHTLLGTFGFIGRSPLRFNSDALRFRKLSAICAVRAPLALPAGVGVLGPLAPVVPPVGPGALPPPGMLTFCPG